LEKDLENSYTNYCVDIFVTLAHFLLMYNTQLTAYVTESTGRYNFVTVTRT